MGVRGLLSYCYTHHDQCMETFDLVEVARIRGGIQILVDYYSFQQYIIRKFWKSLSSYRENPYLIIIGAEYNTLFDYVVKLVSDLKSLDISLVFFIDASRGTDPEGTVMKMDTWISNHKKNMGHLHNILEICRGRAPAPAENYEPIRAILLEMAIMSALSHCNSEIINIVRGEADFRLAKELISREKAFAIFSNDSDFSIFLGSKFIPEKYFDIENDLCLGEPSDHPEKPVRLMVGVFSTETLMQQLGFVDHAPLIELSIVGGNDYTRSFMYDFYRHSLTFKGRQNIDVFADFVRKYGRVENCSDMREEMKRNPQLQDAIEYSRKVFSLEIDAEPISVRRKGPLTTLLEEGVAEGKFTSPLLAMHHNLYWYRFMFEDYGYGYPTAEYVLGPLRSYIYRMVLIRQEQFVTEYGRTPQRDFQRLECSAHTLADRRVPSLLAIDPNKIFQNLRTFHYIMIHQEPDFDIKYFDRYGRKTGFTCYILRYFLVLNWKQNLFLVEEEFLALIALLFGRQREAKYQQMCIRPLPRSVSIINWFQIVYRTAYFYLSKLLYLTHEFPLPQELFCGSVWVAYHTVCNEEAWERGVQQVSKKQLQEAQQEMNSILRDKRHMIGYLVDGIFSFEANDF